MHSLTKKRLDHLAEFIRSSDEFPSLKAIQKEMNLRSSAHASYLVKLLEESGAIQERPKQSGKVDTAKTLKDQLEAFLARKTVIAIKIDSSLFCVNKANVISAIFEA